MALEIPEPPPVRWWESSLRRGVDLLVTALALVVVGPVMLLIAIMIRMDSPGPSLFRQRRVGVRGTAFTVYKFRTMRTGGDDAALRDQIARELSGEAGASNGSWKLDDDPRVTRLGGVLRRTSLDELPQLFNVVRGEMSLVGPRPCLPWEAEMFPPQYALRFTVRPGLTGLWQVSGRSTVDTLSMLELDVHYVRSRRLGQDMVILARTVPTLLRGDGAR